MQKDLSPIRLLVLPSALVLKRLESLAWTHPIQPIGRLNGFGTVRSAPPTGEGRQYINHPVSRWALWMICLCPPPLCTFVPYLTPFISSPMRARVVPPYPSFTYVMSQIADESQKSQSGPHSHGDVLAKPAHRRPYSKYDENPFMRTVRHDHESVHSSVSAPITHSTGRSNYYPQRSKPQMSLPLVGRFLQKHSSALSQRRKCSSAI